MTWIQVKRQALEDRGYVCEVCGKKRYKGLHAHHVFFRKLKGKPELNVAENMQLVCMGKCHLKADTTKSKRKFWKVQENRYGKDHMRQWHDNLPLKSKERFW